MQEERKFEQEYKPIEEYKPVEEKRVVQESKPVEEKKAWWRARTHRRRGLWWIRSWFGRTSQRKRKWRGLSTTLREGPSTDLRQF